MAQGRGRGQTLPSWMTQGGNDAALDSMLASASQAAAQRERPGGDEPAPKRRSRFDDGPPQQRPAAGEVAAHQARERRLGAPPPAQGGWGAPPPAQGGWASRRPGRRLGAAAPRRTRARAAARRRRLLERCAAAAGRRRARPRPDDARVDEPGARGGRPEEADVAARERPPRAEQGAGHAGRAADAGVERAAARAFSGRAPGAGRAGRASVAAAFTGSDAARKRWSAGAAPAPPPAPAPAPPPPSNPEDAEKAARARIKQLQNAGTDDYQKKDFQAALASYKGALQLLDDLKRDVPATSSRVNAERDERRMKVLSCVAKAHEKLGNAQEAKDASRACDKIQKRLSEYKRRARK